MLFQDAATQNKASRPYQITAHKQIFYAWNEENYKSLFLVMATGSGKTFTAVEIVKEFLFSGKRVMWIAHKVELIEQARDTMLAHQIYPGIIMNTEKTNYSLPVQVCSIQTIARRKELPAADLIVIDEAHHVSKNSQYAKIVALYPDALILMLSATPVRLSGEGFRYVFPERETKPIIAATMKYLIDEGWLCPFDYYISSVPDLSDVMITSMGDYEESAARKAMEMAPLVESYLQHAKGKIGISFAINVAHSKEIRDKYLRAGITAEHIDGETPKYERTRILADYRAGFIKVLTNCGITTEGTDLPFCEFVQHASPTKSLSQAFQKSGRTSRALPGIVDQWGTPLERKYAIASSLKPYGIILDNAGIAAEHMLPDHDHNWLAYFEGRSSQNRKTKKITEEEIEMLVFVGEDEKGNQKRARSMKEIEGMRLVRVDKEARRKIINIKAIKLFDENYAKFQKMAKVKRPGYLAIDDYYAHCKKSNIFIAPETWDYLERRLITDHENEIKRLSAHNSQMTLPIHMFEKAESAIKLKMVSRKFFADKKKAYLKENASQVAEYMVSKLNLTIQK